MDLDGDEVANNKHGHDSYSPSSMRPPMAAARSGEARASRVAAAAAAHMIRRAPKAE